MGGEIRDGTGTGNRVKVDDENMLHVLGVEAELQSHVNIQEGDAYTMDIDGIQTDGVDYWLAIIKNTSDLTMHITSVTLWVPSFSNTQILEVCMGGTFVYAANGTPVVPANCNAGSGKTAVGDFYVNDGSGNITTIGGTQAIVGRYIFGTTPIKAEKRTDWILPKNQVFLLRSDLAEKFTGFISFFYHNNQWE